MSRYSLNLNEEKSSSKTNLIIFISVFIISLVLIFSLSFFLKKRKSHQTPKKVTSKVSKKTPQKNEEPIINKQKNIPEKSGKPSKKKVINKVKKNQKKIHFKMFFCLI